MLGSSHMNLFVLFFFCPHDFFEKSFTVHVKITQNVFDLYLAYFYICCSPTEEFNNRNQSHALWWLTWGKNPRCMLRKGDTFAFAVI